MLGSELAFLSPWTALLTVHATVHRSLSRGVQTTVASSIGVGLSFLIGYFLGVGILTFALALLVGVAAARISWIRDEGVAIATTAIFIFGSGFDEQAPLLDDRILEVAVGVAAGVVVNLLIVPPSATSRPRGTWTALTNAWAASWPASRRSSQTIGAPTRPKRGSRRPSR